MNGQATGLQTAGRTRRCYSLKDGRVLWVGRAFGRFMTMDSDPAEPGRHRFKSPLLPPRDDRDSAQFDLDAYACDHDLPPAQLEVEP